MRQDRDELLHSSETTHKYNNELFSAVVCHTLSGNGVCTEVLDMVHFYIPIFQ